jgi:hypothetical protein
MFCSNTTGCSAKAGRIDPAAFPGSAGVPPAGFHTAAQPAAETAAEFAGAPTPEPAESAAERAPKPAPAQEIGEVIAKTRPLIRVR